MSELMELVKIIVPFQIKHNEESMAVDFLFEVDRVSDIVALTDESTYIEKQKPDWDSMSIVQEFNDYVRK